MLTARAVLRLLWSALRFSLRSGQVGPLLVIVAVALALLVAGTVTVGGPVVLYPFL